MGTFPPMLRTLSALLDKAGAQGRDPAALLEARLAPDMYPLSMQVHIACDQAVAAAAQLTGSDAPALEPRETTAGALAARIARAIDFLKDLPEAAYDGAAGRKIVVEVPGQDFVFDFTAEEFLRDWALPHFYFHVVTAYDILRHEGVPLGKRDYMGHAGRYIRPKA
jgi:hypothetical protein